MKKFKKALSLTLFTFVTCNVAFQAIVSKTVFAAGDDKFDISKTIKQISSTPREEEFEITLKVNKKPNITPKNKIDLGIAFDNSSSIASINSSDTVLRDTKNSVKSMISGLDESLDRVSLTPYKGSVRNGNNGQPLPYSVDTKVSLSSDFNLVKSQIDAMTPYGGTPMYSGVKNAIEDLKNNARSDSEKKLIIVSDGEPTVSSPIVHASDIPVGFDDSTFPSTWDKKYGKDLYEYRYATPADKVPNGDNNNYGQDSFYYQFDGDTYRTPDYRIRRQYFLLYEGAFDFLRKEVSDKVLEAKNAGIDIYVVYIQRYDTTDSRYSIDANTFKQTSIDFMKSLASDNNKFFTIDGQGTNGSLDTIFRKIQEDLKPQSHIITDDIIDKFSIVPNSFSAQLDGVDKTSLISPVQNGNKLTWNFNDEAKDAYELILKYRIKRLKGAVGGTYITSKNPAEFTYNKKTGDTLIKQKLAFPQVEAILKKFGNLTVKYLEEGTNKELAPENNEIKEVGTAYETTLKMLDGYNLKVVPSNSSGKYIDGNIEVVYYYTKNLIPVNPIGPIELKKGIITVKYLEKDTDKELVPSTLTQGIVDAEYITSAKTIDGYVLAKTSDNVSGKYIDGNIEVVYYYTKNLIPNPIIPVEVKEGTVIAKYLDKATNKELLPSIVTKKPVGSDYLVHTKKIDGHELHSVPHNATGKYIDGNIEVIHYYTKNSTTSEGDKEETIVTSEKVEEDKLTDTDSKSDIKNSNIKNIDDKNNNTTNKVDSTNNFTVLPKTGENNPILYYAIGTIFVLAGFLLRRKFKLQK